MARPASSNPAISAYAVTPSDSVSFTQGACAALYVGVTGDVTAVVGSESGQSAVLFKAVPVGILPVSCTRVNNTGTTATNIVALYN
jgi:hypothetical protein